MKTKHKMLGVALVLLGIAGCRNTERSLVSDPYPEFQWGFTTQNFMAPVPASLEASLDFITYAREKGFQWIELRDPHASLTLEECREISAFARSSGIEVNYSVQRGLLAKDFWEVFERGAARVALFNGPGYYRALALRGDEPEGWSEKEFEQMVAVANEASERAEALGIRFTVENADGALDGRGQPYGGMIEFLEATLPGVTLQLDTANLFTGPIAVSPEQARAFVETYAERVSYLHLKSAQDGVPLRWLDGNPLEFMTIFDLVSAAGVRHIAIELGPDDDEKRIRQSMERSVEYLIQKGILRVK
jgi:sugar phosphate isomerase/epimerase